MFNMLVSCEMFAKIIILLLLHVCKGTMLHPNGIQIKKANINYIYICDLSNIYWTKCDTVSERN